VSTKDRSFAMIIARSAAGGRTHASLRLERRVQDDEIVLVVRQPEGAREFPFETLEALEGFQNAMETFLLRIGWTFASFSPERRTPLDRRTFPRITSDRRRWWTDGVPE
jgi:hypothetical protein